jgi:putative oxidoreductase
MANVEQVIGRCLLAALFAAGALQKALDPGPVQDLLVGVDLSGFLVWPALVFNGAAAGLLIANRHIRVVARALALYCVATSYFHLIPSDPWQMSIFVKNWAIAGGLLVLASSREPRP